MGSATIIAFDGRADSVSTNSSLQDVYAFVGTVIKH